MTAERATVTRSNLENKHVGGRGRVIGWRDVVVDKRRLGGATSTVMITRFLFSLGVLVSLCLSDVEQPGDQRSDQ